MDVPVKVLTCGLTHHHECYSMDITGFEPAHKYFLMRHLNTIHEYSWLVNLDDSPNPRGYHLLNVMGNPHEIMRVVTELITSTLNDRIPAFAPTFTPVDPDEKSKWSGFSVRDHFEYKEQNPVKDPCSVCCVPKESHIDRIDAAEGQCNTWQS